MDHSGLDQLGASQFRTSQIATTYVGATKINSAQIISAEVQLHLVAIRPIDTRLRRVIASRTGRPDRENRKQCDGCGKHSVRCHAHAAPHRMTLELPENIPPGNSLVDLA